MEYERLMDRLPTLRVDRVWALNERDWIITAIALHASTATRAAVHFVARESAETISDMVASRTG